MLASRLPRGTAFLLSSPATRISARCVARSAATVASSAVVGDGVEARPTCPSPSPRSILRARTRQIGEDCVIEDFAVVGPDVVLAPGVRIGSHCSVSHCRIGERSRLWPGSHLGQVRCCHPLAAQRGRGNRELPHHASSRFQDGFGFIPGAAEGEAASKVPQLRGIVIGSDVEIGFARHLRLGARSSRLASLPLMPRRPLVEPAAPGAQLTVEAAATRVRTRPPVTWGARSLTSACCHLPHCSHWRRVQVGQSSPHRAQRASGRTLPYCGADGHCGCGLSTALLLLSPRHSLPPLARLRDSGPRRAHRRAGGPRAAPHCGRRRPHRRAGGCDAGRGGGGHRGCAAVHNPPLLPLPCMRGARRSQRPHASPHPSTPLPQVDPPPCP